MKINVKATLALKPERKIKVKPLPQVNVAINTNALISEPKEKSSDLSPKTGEVNPVLAQL